MNKRSIISRPPDPCKKGGPPSPTDVYRRDGEQPAETFGYEVMPALDTTPAPISPPTPRQKRTPKKKH